MNNPNIIYQFTDEYEFLSNYYISPIMLNFGTFPTVAHYYQSSKTKDREWFHKISHAETAHLAEHLGKKCPIRETWSLLKDSFMMKAIRYKFSKNQELKKKLIDTEKSIIIYCNDLEQSYWGYDIKHGYGQNRLGQILMIVRLWAQEGKI